MDATAPSPSHPRTPRFGAARRVPAIGLTVALAVSLVGLTAPVAANADIVGGSFGSSFETSDAQPSISTKYSDPVNVTGKRFGAGSLLGQVTAVTASGENAPSELAVNAADGDSTTKWLVRSNTGSLVYKLDAAAVVKQYKLTSANDAEGRNPKAWQVQGSNDNSTWTTIDTQSNQSFSGFFTTNTYSAASNTTAYQYYKLNITANNGEPLIQLADWEILDGSTTPGTPTPLVTELGNGPVSGPNIKSGVGFTGKRALRYAGSHLADGAASSTNVLYTGLDTTIGDTTELSYKVFPVLTSDLKYPATYVAVDALLDDGSLLSSHADLTDANGFGISAKAQGTEKALYGNQWNSVKISLGSLAGKKVSKLLFSYDNPNGTGATSISGWVDDVKIADGVTIDPSSRTNYVDTRRGTNSSASFSRGNNIPATAVPNGFNFFTPMTDATSQSWLYNYASSNNANNLPTLQAIGISHEPSPWMGDRAQLAVMPSLTATQPNATPSTRALEFSHDNEIAKPELYSVSFTNGIGAAVTPTDHSGIYSFTFPAASTVGTVMIDRVAGDSALQVAANGDVTGWVQNGSGLSAGNSRMFISGSYDIAPTTVGMSTGRTSAAYGNFPLGASKKLNLRIATSFISLAQAKKNLDLEVTGKSFADVEQEARAKWNDRLGVIDVADAAQAELVTLNSSLYRLNLYPNSQSENTGTAANPDWKYASPVSPQSGAATATTTNAKIVSGQIYVNNGFWDTYRTVWPLYSFLYPDFAEKLVDGFVQQYRDGGWIARWSSPGYADLMTGTSSDASFAEAYVSGALPTGLALEAYDAAVKNATVLPTNNAVGRKGIDTSAFLGYTSTATGESVSWGLEGYINDYAIGSMAAKLAKDPDTPAARVGQLNDEASYFHKRAEDYVNMFDPAVDFFQGRTPGGAFAKSPETFNPEQWGGDYTETDGWNFAFHAPFDIDGLSSLYGGTDGLLNKLDTFFATPETAWSSGIHEAFEARDVRLGQLGMSNQVSHHIPYMYAGAGKPSKTQGIVREIMQRLFVGSDIGQGYPGDEDNGEFSAWYVFSALGMYPLSLASGEYTAGSPLFGATTVHLKGGDLHINAVNNSRSNVYVQSATFNGAALDSATLDTSKLRQGGTLTFQMGGSPSSWGDKSSPADSARTPYVDTTTSTTGVVSSSDSSDLANLVDDNSRSAVTFTKATPAISWESTSGPAAIASYTITNGATGASPKSWTLEGSNDGDAWMPVDERSNQSFSWATQTRPFTVATPTLYSRYRLSVTATNTGAAPTISEIELLADTMQQSDNFELFPLGKLVASAGSKFDGPLATLTGGTSADFTDYDATVDFMDGTGPQAATISKSKLGSLQVSAAHTWSKPGKYNARVTVAEGDLMASAIVTITVSRDESLEGTFSTSCITVPGTAANCDGLGYGYDKDSLAASGFVQGSTVAVPTTDLTFDLPDIAPGENDNVTAKGQTFRLHLGSDATKISIIGTANETAQHDSGVITYDDGSTQDVAIDFGDWVGTASNPSFGNIVVGKTTKRLAGTSGGDGQSAAIFATAPVDLTPGKTAVSFTLPDQEGSLGDGLIHVFAVASNGTRTAPVALKATAVPVDSVDVGDIVEANLATVTGGDPLDGDYTATVNWGDETPVDDGTITKTDSGATVSGSHLYAMAGDYTITVTVDDGEKSAAVTTTVSVVAPNYTPTLKVTNNPVAPGGSVTVTGDGFKKNESVTVELSSQPVVRTTVTADGSGSIAATLTVPSTAPDGSYPITAIGAKSQVTAEDQVTVETPKIVTNLDLAASDTTVTIGSPVTLTATLSGGAPGSIEFFDGTASLGLVSVVDGAAKLKLDSLTAVAHVFTAKYAGDETFAGSDSGSVTVTVKKGTVSLAAPLFSKSSQVYGSSSVATVTTTVSGATTGRVTFQSGSLVLGSAPIVKKGSVYSATLKLSSTLKVGYYRAVVATYSETPTSSASTSDAAAHTFTVKKATTTVTVSGKSFAKNSHPVITVKVATLTNGKSPSGKVAIYVNGHKVKTATLYGSAKGKLSVTLPSRYSSSIKVKAKFSPTDSAHVSSATSKSVSVKRK